MVKCESNNDREKELRRACDKRDPLLLAIRKTTNGCLFFCSCIRGGRRETSFSISDTDLRKCIQKSVWSSISLVNHFIFTSSQFGFLVHQ